MDYEEKYNGYIYIDEAGRGNLAGEMVFTGVKVIGDVSIADDSKKTTMHQREIMLKTILQNVEYITVITTVEEIDSHGLSTCIKKSLEKIIKHFPNEKYLYDGSNTFGVINEDLHTLVKGDALVKGVGAASIIAKTTKDKLMVEHHNEFPQYNWINNQGYGTHEHIEAIKNHGYSKYHRRSFKVKELEKWTNTNTTQMLF